MGGAPGATVPWNRGAADTLAEGENCYARIESSSRESTSMNTPDVPGPSEDRPPRDSTRSLASPARRRFTRGGMAATALLGSLPSMPVLGQSAPYDCTLSGMVSGNQSFRRTRSSSGNCTNVGLGKSPADWAADDAWTPYIRGALPTGNGSNVCNYSTTLVQGTLFKDALLANVFFQGPVKVGNAWVCTITYQPSGTGPVGSSPATLLQVLMQDGKSDDMSLGALFGATLLNCTQAGFPLSPAQVRDMYAQVRTTDKYMTDTAAGKLEMTRAQVVAYLQNLYNAAS
jgi:hypothetical protein